jgi:hypothetical protein
MKVHICKYSNSHIATMEHSSSSSFTDLVNSSLPSSNPQNTNTQQHGFQPHMPTIFPPHQYDPRSFPPHYFPQHFNPFGVVQPGYQRFPSSNYHHGIPFHGNFYGGDRGANPSSPAGSAIIFAVGGSIGEGSSSPFGVREADMNFCPGLNLVYTDCMSVSNHRLHVTLHYLSLAVHR